MSLTSTHHAGAPPEARGLARDQVRLLVATPTQLTDTVFHTLPSHLRAGDLLVVNTSGTLPAALDGFRRSGDPVVVHLASTLDDGTWLVEVRPPGRSSGPVTNVRVGERITLPAQAHLTVLDTPPGQVRLHRGLLECGGPVTGLLERFGRPIAYGYVTDRWPLADYQTLFATEPGSAEMPSAGRPFTARTITDLARNGVLLAPVLLHCGVSSPEGGEPPRPERYRVPASTAALIAHVRRGGGRIVAVGTTVTRALETTRGLAGAGWTDLMLGPDTPAQVVNGLVTGWHEPGASHLQLLRAVAGHDLVDRAYEEASARDYLWHEFGDSCLLLP